MAFEVQIMCVNKTTKPDPHKRISSIGGEHKGKKWHISVETAIRGMEAGHWEFYTLINDQKRYVEIAVSTQGNKYLRTSGSTDTLDLIGLENCTVHD